jgi:hypothetical protein
MPLKRRIIWIFLLIIALVISNTYLIRAQENDEINQVKDELSGFLNEYQQQGGGNTIPIEQNLIKLMKLKAGTTLFETMKNAPTQRFDGEFIWAICATGDSKIIEPLISYIDGISNKTQKIQCCKYLGGFTSDIVSKFISKCLNETDDNNQKQILRGALLSSGDKQVLEALKNDLKDKDINKKVSAIQLAGLANNQSFLEYLTPLLNDKTIISPTIKSNLFPIVEITKTENSTSESSKPRELKTIKDVALESANLLFKKNTPDMIAWWYEKIGNNPVFGFDDAAAKNILDLYEFNKKARSINSLKLKTANEAINTAISPDEDIQLKDPKMKVVLASGKDIESLKSKDSQPKYWVIEFSYTKRESSGAQKSSRRKVVLDASTLAIIETVEIK